jgi:hypothetical protein
VRAGAVGRGAPDAAHEPEVLRHIGRVVPQLYPADVLPRERSRQPRAQGDTLYPNRIYARDLKIRMKRSLPRVLPVGQYALGTPGRILEDLSYGAGGFSGLEPPWHVWPGVTMLGFSSP